MLTNKYWEDRYRAEERARELADKRVAYQLHGVYQQHANNIQKEIDSFWQRYADKEGITKLGAKQRADRLDMVTVEFKAKQLVERANRLRKRGQKVTLRDFSKTENDLMKLYNLKMKTSRLEVLQANIQLHQYDLALSEFEIIDKHLTESIRRENLFNSGVLRGTLGNFDSSKVSADSLVFANFNGATWSNRFWTRQNELRNVVKKGVADTVLRGKGTNVLINNLKKEFDVSYGYARRLAVTESARVYSEAQKANYEANGVEEFEIMTELKACQICQPFNGKIFKVSELVPALNVPPFHPNCRCTTVPHFRKKQSNADEQTIFNIDFPDYIKKVLDNEFSIKGQNVVLRKERLDHILEGHSDIGTDVPNVLKRTILKPDLILKDNKNDQTAMFVKKDSINLVNTIVKLSNANNYDNSVITAFRISDKRYNRLLKKNTALLKRDDML
jgi:SPP1 gp7 family putative phage head morphogenesis protein